ncbi:DUF6753 family protein [Coleofasciculus sp.]|uniref:DUF6753 family protein n=1 Tax=Coleofasciculus sp. TaxID=3100458 RepID=UPI0039FAE402
MKPSLLDKLLDGRDEVFKRKVLHLVSQTGYSENDPLFVILIVTGTLQTLLNDKPAELEQMFSRWFGSVTKSLDLVEQEIVERQKTAIAEAAGDLIKKAERQESQRFFKSILPGAIASSVVLVVGFVAGITVPPAVRGGYVAGERLTAEDVEVLRWAKSSDGRYARQLLDWNADYLKVCERDIVNIPVKLKMGTQEAKRGFCLLYTKPPEARL